ncbi:hypothetical protein M758_2G001500 [Ceratodon purpureus]|uniref:Uncharacterized protein n=1 Tax=Ceratodon purpureus TaxID=3225 RepID=A0A8T0INE3_CERPU|nr:hypothetical protein KC19_2G001400 [Ceratodon purpureus]KAG0624757.1 hypothetical protein M758_2G001500 [Ceratodon purpureus]
MESQDPNDWQLPLSQLLVDPSQPSSSRRHLRDEAGPSERCVQPQIEPGIPQFSLPALQSDNMALVINNEGRMVSRISSKVGYRFWLQGQLNLLTRERRASFIAAIILRILEFVSV